MHGWIRIAWNGLGSGLMRLRLYVTVCALRQLKNTSDTVCLLITWVGLMWCIWFPFPGSLYVLFCRYLGYFAMRALPWCLLVFSFFLNKTNIIMNTNYIIILSPDYN